MNLIKSLILILCVIAPVTLGSPAVYANDSKLFTACNTNDQTKNNKTVCPSQGTKKNPVNHILHVAANILALITGLAAVILIIVSGISMITSGGNSEAVGNARKRLINAVIGLVIVALAWTIISFATDKLIT
ncbi:MAG TPA: pilin [Candidatus Saccharimonadales bacterium]|nr:pilin [Candidatus Saccharimonadales bacterium]